MKQKIDLYREVLSLEPDSKVFFPLARLLEEDGRLDEAISVLRQGIARHPDYLEGKLMLIDLLFRQGDYDIIVSELDAMTQVLGKYDGFWSAWIESLAQDADSRDAATALRFFNASLNGHSISWSAVLEQGLGSFFSKEGQQPVPFVVRGQTESEDAAGQSKKNTSNRQLKAETDKTAKTSAEKTVVKEPDQPAKPASKQPADQAVSGAKKQEEQKVASGPAPSVTVAVAVEAAKPARADAAPGVTQSSMAELVGVSASIDAEVENVDDSEAIVLTAVADEGGSDELELDADFDIEADIDPDGDDEAFSLNTKSMAEVLTEQGDYVGALNIYEALLKEAGSPEEVYELEAAIAKVSSMVGVETQEAASKEEDQEEAVEMGTGKNRLIGVLETLAQKLETKS